MPDLGWSRYVEDRERQDDLEWLLRVRDDLTCLGNDYPAMVWLAAELRDRVDVQLLMDGEVGSASLTAAERDAVLGEIRRRGPHESADTLLECARDVVNEALFTDCGGRCGRCDACVNAADDEYHRRKEEG